MAQPHTRNQPGQPSRPRTPPLNGTDHVEDGERDMRRENESPRDDSGRKRELNILLLIQGARVQKLRKVSRFESFNILVPFKVNDAHFSSPCWIMTF